jgi:membrane protein DedA with SNARE-associated domain
LEDVLRIVETHGLPVVFGYVLLKQIGLPLPGAPALLMFGALAGEGRLNAWASLLAGLAASVAADLAWFEVGRRRGSKVMAFLCKVSLEPDTCVSKSQDLFARHGVRSLLVAKFVPGFDTLAPPMAGMLGLPLVRFVAWTTGGALVWLLVFGGLGYVLSDRIAEVAAAADRWAGTIGWAAAVLFAAYIAWKVVQRQRVLRLLRMARIAPEELRAMLDEGRETVIVDVRGAAAVEVLPIFIPGALRIRLEDVDTRHAEIPRGKDIIVYCS